MIPLTEYDDINDGKHHEITFQEGRLIGYSTVNQGTTRCHLLARTSSRFTERLRVMASGERGFRDRVV